MYHLRRFENNIKPTVALTPPIGIDYANLFLDSHIGLSGKAPDKILPVKVFNNSLLAPLMDNIMAISEVFAPFVIL